jgi:hypothetical protein
MNKFLILTAGFSEQKYFAQGKQGPNKPEDWKFFSGLPLTRSFQNRSNYAESLTNFEITINRKSFTNHITPMEQLHVLRMFANYGSRNLHDNDKPLRP